MDDPEPTSLLLTTAYQFSLELYAITGILIIFLILQSITYNCKSAILSLTQKDLDRNLIVCSTILKAIPQVKNNTKRFISIIIVFSVLINIGILMTFKIGIFALQKNTIFKNIPNLILQNNYSIIPVCDKNIDGLTGLLHSKNLIQKKFKSIAGKTHTFARLILELVEKFLESLQEMYYKNYIFQVEYLNRKILKTNKNNL